MSEIRETVDLISFERAPALQGEWAGLLTQATSVERVVLEALAASGIVTVPALGLELGDGIPVSLAWQEHQLAAVSGLTEDDIADLGAAGWRLVDLDASAIISALTGE